MLKDRENVIKGITLFNKAKIYESLFGFLDKNLKDFPAYKNEIDKNMISEDLITQLLDTFLQERNREEQLPFIFKNQFKYSSSRRSSDIGIIFLKFSKKDAFFVLEAKRLPTPGHGREREYVEGNLGGIERFKRSVHGENLPFGGMIAYIQKGKLSDWFNKVNKWIDNLIISNSDSTIVWDKNDLLIDLKNSDVSKFKSNNSRLKKKGIVLYHYWLILTSAK